MKLFLIVSFFLSSNSFGVPREVYYQKILGILNRQFSEGVLTFDKAFKKRAKKKKGKYGRKSREFKKLVDYYDSVKRKLYFQQNDATKIIRDYLKPYERESLKQIHLSLSSFDKIFYPENYIKDFYVELNQVKRVKLVENSLSGRLKSYYEISDILNKLGFRSERKVNYALNLIVEKSKVTEMAKLERVLKSMLFKSFLSKYKPFIVELEIRIEKYVEKMP